MRSATPRELASEPVGKFSSGRSFIHFCAAPSLWGVILWGRPDGEDALALGKTLVLELEPAIASHGSIIDARRVEGIDAGAFKLLETYVQTNHAALREKVLRLALVRPSGLEGAVVAGFFEVLPAPYPVATFADVPAALRWLASEGATSADPDEVGRLLDETFTACAGVPPVVRELRAVLAANLGGIGVAEAARAMGLSERTLQRRLTEASTTFVDEVTDVRLRAAQRMMLDSDAPLTTIALDVGCASLQHFSAMFRRLTGESPSAWRDKRRA